MKVNLLPLFIRVLVKEIILYMSELITVVNGIKELIIKIRMKKGVIYLHAKR